MVVMEEMSEEWNFRLADARDVETLVEFNRAMASETESKDLDLAVLTTGVENLLRDTRYGFYVVAEYCATANEREVAGALLVTYEWSDWRNGVFWWIQSVYVKPLFRRQGVYRRLYEFIKQRAAKESNVCGFRLYVEKENRVAQATYEQLGMTETYYRMFEELCGR